MTGFEMCTLLMCVVSHKITDEYDWLYNSYSTNQKKLVKELTKIENKLKNSSKYDTDSRNCGQPDPPSETRTQKDNHHKSKGDGPGMAQLVPRKVPTSPRDTGMCCALCNKYGGAAKSNTIHHCKRWTGAGNDHPAWRGRTASKISTSMEAKMTSNH